MARPKKDVDMAVEPPKLNIRDKMLKAVSPKILEKTLYSREEFNEAGNLNSGIPAINILMTGTLKKGFPRYKLSELAAPSTFGKTTILLNAIREAQKLGDFIFFIDTEFRFNYDLAENCGVNVSEDFMTIIQTNRVEDIKILVAQTLEDLSKADQKQVTLIIDSWGALISTANVETIAEEEKDKKDIRILSAKNDLVKLLTGLNCTVLMTNWTHEQIGSMSKTETISGGSGRKYLGNNVIQGTSTAKDYNASTKEMLGKFVTWTTHKSSDGGIEGVKMTLRLQQAGGIDPYYGLLNDALEFGIIEKSGNRYKSKFSDKLEWEKDIYTAEFWTPIYNDDGFNEFIEDKYCLTKRAMKGKDFSFSTDLNIAGL